MQNNNNKKNTRKLSSPRRGSNWGKMVLERVALSNKPRLHRDQIYNI